MTPIDKIRARLAACPIPEGARADWDGTNHFEIQNPIEKEGFWWLDCIPDIFAEECSWCATEGGKRLGACLDYACAYRGDVAALLDQIDGLRSILDAQTR
jgi:hypothetical protein